MIIENSSLKFRDTDSINLKDGFKQLIND